MAGTDIFRIAATAHVEINWKLQSYPKMLISVPILNSFTQKPEEIKLESE